jgi:hypothetical protein
MRQPHTPGSGTACTGNFQQQAVAQYAEHGFRDDLALVGAETLILEKIAQRGVGGMLQRQYCAQCLDAWGTFLGSGAQFNRAGAD